MQLPPVRVAVGVGDYLAKPSICNMIHEFTWMAHPGAIGFITVEIPAIFHQ
jgi:hypothetical protein